MKSLRLFVYGLTLLFSTVAVGADSEHVPVSLVLQWTHQSQFAGYYMALEKGFFSDEGLDVSIRTGGADIDPVARLKTGDAQFCTAMLSTAVQSDVEVRMLAQVVNRSNFAVVAWRNGRNGEESILEPTDLSGKRLTIWESFRPPYDVFMTQQKFTPVILPQHQTVSLFLRKGSDACSAMLYNEYHQLLQYAVEESDITVFRLSEYGIVLPEDGIYCLQTYAEKYPKRCRAFARACMKGWAYARDHREETLDVVMRYVEADKIATNRTHMARMLHEILASIYPDKEMAWSEGSLSRDRYQRAMETLGLSTVPLYEDFVSKEARGGKN